MCPGKPVKRWVLSLKVRCPKTPVSQVCATASPLREFKEALKSAWEILSCRSEAGGEDLIHSGSLGSLTESVNTWTGVGYSHYPESWSHCHFKK